MSSDEQKEKLRADKAEAELRAFKHAFVVCMGEGSQNALKLLERVAAGHLANGGY